MRGMLKRFKVAAEGVALIEFAMVFPVFFLLLFGGIEINRLILTQQKHEKAGYAIADIITQYQSATTTGAAGEINVAELTQNVLPQFSRIMSPYDDDTRQAIIVTSIRKTAAGAKNIQWQVAGGGFLSGCDTSAPPVCVRSVVNDREPSAVSTAVRGMATAFPAEVETLINATGGGEDLNIIITEVFYAYEPILQQVLQSVGAAGGDGMMGFDFYVKPRIFVKRTYFLPRSGALYGLPPDFPVP